jgi:hypothetical protein
MAKKATRRQWSLRLARALAQILSCTSRLFRQELYNLLKKQLNPPPPPLTKDNALDRLAEFERAATKLLAKNYIQDMTPETMKFSISGKRLTDEGAFEFSTSPVDPDEDRFESFLCLLRQFYNKDPFSFRKILQVYESGIPPQELCAEYLRQVGLLNNYLDAYSGVYLAGENEYGIHSPHPPHGATSFTRRDIFEIVMFGEIVHVDENKRFVYRKWRENRLFFPLVAAEFNTVCRQFVTFILRIKDHHQRTYQALAGS